MADETTAPIAQPLSPQLRKSAQSAGTAAWCQLLIFASGRHALENYPASNLDGAFLTCSQFVATQSTKPCIGRSKLLPRLVISYSTRGGTSGNTSRVINPSRSRFRKVSVNILCEIPGIALSSSENRARPPSNLARESIRKILHLSPIFVRSSRTAAGSLCPQTAAGSKCLFLPAFFMANLYVSYQV